MTDDAAKATDGTPPHLMPTAPEPPVVDAEASLPHEPVVDPDPAPPLPAPPPPAPPPPTASPVAVQRASRGLAVLLALVCVLALVGAGYLYWLSRDAAITLASRLDGLEQTMSGLNQRVAALEHRPVPVPVDLKPLDQRLTALEQKPPPVAQLDAAGQAEIASLAGRMDALTAREDQLGTREQTDIVKLGDQLAGQDARIAEQESKINGASKASATAGGLVDALTQRETRLAAMQAAGGALAAGRPLGTIPGAPPALAQFADKPPPTGASLRLSFADAARAAHEAGMPTPGDQPFFARIWAHMQSSVTVRQGDHVLVGDTVSGILAQSQSQLDAGDLAGAVATLGQLDGPAGAAMAPWRQRAQSLLDARAALLTLARG